MESIKRLAKEGQIHNGDKITYEHKGNVAEGEILINIDGSVYIEYADQPCKSPSAFIKTASRRSGERYSSNGGGYYQYLYIAGKNFNELRGKDTSLENNDSPDVKKGRNVLGVASNLIESFDLKASSINDTNNNNKDNSYETNGNNNNLISNNNNNGNSIKEDEDNQNQIVAVSDSLEGAHKTSKGRLDNLKQKLETETMKKILDIAQKANSLVVRNEKIIMDQNTEILHLKKVIKDNLFIHKPQNKTSDNNDEVVLMMKSKELFDLKKKVEENEVEREEFRRRIEEFYVQIYEAEKENNILRAKLESEALLRAELTEKLEKALQDHEQLQIEKTKTYTAFLNEKMQMYEVQKTLAIQLDRVCNENDELKAKINENDLPRKGSGLFSFF